VRNLSRLLSASAAALPEHITSSLCLNPYPFFVMQLPIQQQVYSYLPSKPTFTTKPSHDSRFREDLGMDQIDFFELVIRLENLYHVRIPDNELEQVKTVQQLINCLNDQVVGQRWNCATLMA
jgi:acyl carrier protein